MTRVLFLLFLSLYLAVVDVNGDSKNEIDCKVEGSCTVALGDEFRNHDEVLWTGRLSSIALQVKNEAQVEKRGTTSKLYYTVRQPPKKADKLLRKRTGRMHKMAIRGVAKSDSYARKGAIIAHDALKDAIISMDKGFERAHHAVRKSSSWLDDKLLLGSKKTHHAVKHTAIPVHRGVAQGSVVAYGTVRKSIAAVDSRLQQSVRALDQQLSGRMVKAVPVKFFLNQFVNSKGKRRLFGRKKSKSSTAALPAPETAAEKESEPPVESEAPTATEDEAVSAASETESPPATPVSSTESNRSEDPDAYKAASPDHPVEDEKLDDFDMDDDNHFDDNHKGAELKDSAGTDDGEVRTMPPSDRKKGWDYMFDDDTVKQIRAFPRTVQKNVPQALTKVKRNAGKSLSKMNARMPQSLPKMPKSLSTMSQRSLSKLPRSFSNVPASLSRMNLPRSFSKVNVPRSISSKVRVPRALKN